MKKYVYVTLIAGFTIGSCNLADKDDYANVAEDMCSCLNSKSEDISQGMKTAIIDAVEKNQTIEHAMEAYALQNPDSMENDIIAMAQLGESFEACGVDLEVKYKDLYTNDSDKEIQRRLLEALNKNQKCKWTAAITKAGMQDQ